MRTSPPGGAALPRKMVTMTRRTPARLLPLRLVVLTALVVALLAVPAQASGGASARLGVVELPVTFTVHNTNRTEVDCATDGGTYQIRGKVVAPRGALRSAEAVTLYLHGLDYGAFFNDFEAVPGYDFARKQAQDGHVSVVVDRLGYDRSDKADGFDICFGSHADIASQIVDQLRAGDYDTRLRHSRAFDQVVLAGHSVGGMISQIAAYTFDNVDGLMVLSYSDLQLTPAAQQASAYATATCQQGGFPAEAEDDPSGYVFFGATPQDFIGAHFFLPNADPAVVDVTANVLRNRNPCGDVLSYQSAVATNLANVGGIKVPTLVAAGTEDNIYPNVPHDQATLLTGVDDLTVASIAQTGHAVTLHRSADEFQQTVSDWLTARGFGPARGRG